MIRLIAVVIAVAAATSAQATSLAPLHDPGSMITQVRQGCGAGMYMVNGRCVSRQARRHVRRVIRRAP
jgi:hypothetical protein